MAQKSIAVKDIMQDLVKNTVSTGFFDKIRVVATNKSVTMEALETNKQVILKAHTDAPVDGWQGEFGLANLSLLSSIVNDSEYAHKDSRLEMIYQPRDGQDVPSELHYTNRSKTFVAYRFVAKNMVPDQPKYNEPTWEVSWTPAKSAIQQFSWAANSLSTYEQYFIPRTVDGALKFFIGEENGANQRGGVVMAPDIQGEFDSNHKWQISLIQQALKLTDGVDSELKLSVKGALQLNLSTGLVNYKLVFPAKVR